MKEQFENCCVLLQLCSIENFIICRGVSFYNCLKNKAIVKTIISISLLLFLLHLNVDANVRRLEYSVFVSGNNVGTLQAVCTQSSDSVRIISLQTRLSFPFRKVFSNIQVRYHHNTLVYASSEKHLNEELKEWITVSKQQERYRIESHDSEPKYFNSAISFSVGLLYHYEPKNKSSIFSERLGAYVPIKPTGASVYEMRQPDGKTNTFTYRDGICTEMQTEMMASRVKFKLNETK